MAQEETGYVDAAGQPFYYKLTAIDAHGNESAPALVQPAGTTDVSTDASGEIAFAAPSPNPARSSVLLRISLPRETRGTLRVFDVHGALVRMLFSGEQAAGEHSIAWDLRDDRGGRLPAGLYFARFEAAGRTWSQRIAAVE